MSRVIALRHSLFRIWLLPLKAFTSLVVLSASLLLACSSNQPAPEKQVQANLAKPVELSTAQADIKTLNSEKTRTSQ